MHKAIIELFLTESTSKHRQSIEPNDCEGLACEWIVTDGISVNLDLAVESQRYETHERAREELVHLRVFLESFQLSLTKNATIVLQQVHLAQIHSLV